MIFSFYCILTTIYDNTTTTYTDNTADGDLGGYAEGLLYDGLENTTAGKIIVDSANALTLGKLNTFVGQNSGRVNILGSRNSTVGTSTLYSNIHGYDNTAVGNSVLYSNVNGYENSGVGSFALYYNISGYGNSAIGAKALLSNTSGSYNTAAGQSAGYKITTGTYNSFLGYNAGNNASQKIDATNSMALGNGTYTTANNQIVIGNTSIVQTLIRGIINIKTKTPASAAAAGTDGDLCWDASYIYVCIATDTWKRAGIATW